MESIPKLWKGRISFKKHVYIQDQHIRPNLASLYDGLGEITSFPDELNSGIVAQNPPNSVADYGMVVGK